MSSGITIMASVYDGRQRVGYVLHHLDERGFEAIDVEKTQLRHLRNTPRGGGSAAVSPNPAGVTKPASTAPDECRR